MHGAFGPRRRLEPALSAVGPAAAAPPPRLLLKPMRNPQRDIFAPRRRNDLYADRQGRQRNRDTGDGQPDEGNRLRVDAEIGPHRQFDSAELERLLTDQRRRARRRRRQDRVDILEQLQHFALIPASELLRAPPAEPAPSRRRSAGRARRDRNPSARVRSRSRCRLAPSVAVMT